ncbi:hypothetical protein [Parapedobacter lycopersici]|uniref:hypothetical protein n=1 Tax=Parapedobacter lycopersici TaxID=1864939 RepID=UPI00214D7563|nr:hypothetical protein [Parapedobacter lycopersici]
MWLILIPIIGSILYVLIWGWVKLVNFLFNPVIKKLEAKKARLQKTDNPYIVQHRMRVHNDKMYDEYLEWMSKHYPGVPIDKFKFPEEQAFEREMNSANRPFNKNK